MHLVHPAARQIRTLYSLSAERLWFSLAVVVGLILAVEIVELILLQDFPKLLGAAI